MPQAGEEVSSKRRRLLAPLAKVAGFFRPRSDAPHGNLGDGFVELGFKLNSV